MTGAPFKAAFAAFVEAFERARANLAIDVRRLVVEPSDVDEELDIRVLAILEGSEKAAKDGFIIVERAALWELRAIACGVSDELPGVFRDFDWEVARALRQLRQAPAHEETTP